MNPSEIDFLNFENDLLKTRKKLNDLIYEVSKENPDTEKKALYQDKINYLEAELKYMNNQFQIVKGSLLLPGEAKKQSVPTPVMSPAMPAMPVKEAAIWPQGQKQTAKRDYEKIFGKSFMGIFASVLIFISLIIFATLLLPYLTDAMKLTGLYLLSFALLIAGFALTKRNAGNKFYIALIGCGVGSLYISLLLSDLYFKIFGDILLYCFILVWAVFVRYLSRLKSMVFHVIGHSGILIATILGTILCIREADEKKFLVLTIFYFISAFVFANRHTGKAGVPAIYEHNLCNHIFKSCNLIVLLAGISETAYTHLRIINIALLMIYILFEFYFSYREECKHGLAFQIITLVNTLTFTLLFGLMDIVSKTDTYLFVYLFAAAVLFYVHKKNAGFRIVSEVCCFIMIFNACFAHSFLATHLYAYLTVIPFMLYGRWKKNPLYLYAGLFYLLGFPLIQQVTNANIETLIMIILVYLTFLYCCKNMDITYFKIIGYIGISYVAMRIVGQYAMLTMQHSAPDYSYHEIRTKTDLITFFALAIPHLILNRLEYFGREKAITIMMLALNGLLMTMGCFAIQSATWQIPVILITALLFIVNSKKILEKRGKAGFYIAFKYTVLMLCILTSFDVTNYIISICLLLFAILSIIVGFYKKTITFRLYGLVLSMISVVKLIMIDIQYDSTMENAISFFVSGVLCFIISFLYNRIDHNFKKE